MVGAMIDGSVFNARNGAFAGKTGSCPDERDNSGKNRPQ
jgi:hypothetical protein